ncbi:autophagy-related protein 27 [Bipolaris maydis]|nr:autophagy-related protein 27 [Bipolaris maydis]
MAPSRSRASLLSLLAATTLLPQTAWAFDCKDILADGAHFNFKELGGPHTVHWEESDLEKELKFKYNFTLDICNALKWHKGGSLDTECHHGARVCAIREMVDLSKENSTSITPIDIAGTYPMQNGRTIDAKFENLGHSKSNSDAREGVRATLNGGRFPFDDKKEGIDQRAIIEFVCDKDRSGSEGNEVDNSPREDGDKDDKDGDKKDGDKKNDDKKDDNKDDKKEGKLKAREENNKGKCEDSDASLRFCGYAVEPDTKDKKVRTLRLEWRTKYACADAPEPDNGSHWGFFGWFFIILFLAIASYLIFGSWLNYNRYGARGWDALPHGDAIRDIPYVAKDFARKVLDTVQGSGSRGGYAAV